MDKYIQKITCTIQHSKKKVEIDLKGRNLIIVGKNGSGKTAFLNQIYERLVGIIIEKEKDVKGFQAELTRYENNLKNDPNDLNNQRWLKQTKEKINTINKCNITISDKEDFIGNFQERRALLRFFKATRQIKIEASSGVSSFKNLQNVELKNYESASLKDYESGSLLENFLSTNKMLETFAKEEKDKIVTNRIKSFFSNFINNLRFLFEDELLDLKFKKEELTFYIHQRNKEPYTFKTLSSGFSSILNVYADLLIKVELTEISPKELTGVVIIDEIDAHLHVSLQRKILSFLTAAFPNVQFIVSTHSPFVITSVNDAVIYDLSKYEQVDDLSFYSYEAVLEGLFGVLPSSDLLQEKIKELDRLITESNSDNIKRVEKLISDIKPHKNKLDEESQYFLQKAEIYLSKNNIK